MANEIYIIRALPRENREHHPILIPIYRNRRNVACIYSQGIISVYRWEMIPYFFGIHCMQEWLI